MKHFQKVLPVLLAAGMVFCLFGCETKKPIKPIEPATQPANTGEYADYPASLGVECYDPSREFEIGVPETNSQSFFCLSCEEDFNGYFVHDSMVRRDKELSENHGIDIMYRTYPANDDGRTLAETVQRLVLAGTKTSDMIGGGLNLCIQPLNAQSGLLKPINKLQYVDFEKPWWAEYFINGVSYKGVVNYAASMALGPGFFGSPYVMVCNLKLQEDGAFFSDGTQMDIFDLVETGEWTLDAFYDIIRNYTIDLNSDGNIRAVDDLLAYAHMRTDVTADCHYIAAGMKFCEKDESDGITVNLWDENVIDTVDRLQMIFDTIKDNYDKGFDEKGSDLQINTFINGHALFFGNSMTYVTRLLEMVADYAIIPLPKGSEEQPYYTGINTWTSAYIAVPNQTMDEAYVGQTLELLGYYSWKTIRPVIYDKVLSVRLARDGRQLAIMDTIYSSLYTDLNQLYNWGGSEGIVNTSIMNADLSYATRIASVKDAIPLLLEKFDRDMKQANQDP